MPLETVLGFEYDSFKSDIWALGVLLLQYLVGKNNIFGSPIFYYYNEKY